MSALDDMEDGPPNVRPESRLTSIPPSPIEHFQENLPDTLRPPPAIDFSKMSADAKLDWLCRTMVDQVNGQLEIRQNMTVLNARLGVLDGEDGSPSLFQRMTQLETATNAITLDVEQMRRHLLGEGASIHELQRAEESRATDRPRR